MEAVLARTMGIEVVRRVGRDAILRLIETGVKPRATRWGKAQARQLDTREKESLVAPAPQAQESDEQATND